MSFLPILSAIAMVATTAAASAQPGPGPGPGDGETGGRVSYTERRLPPTPASDSRWIALSSATSVDHGTALIMVGAEAGRLLQLRVDACAGTVILRRLRVFERDGTVRTVLLGRRLDRTHRSVVIDLAAGSPIDQIAITTETGTRGVYTVHGSVRAINIAMR